MGTIASGAKRSRKCGDTGKTLLNGSRYNNSDERLIRSKGEVLKKVATIISGASALGSSVGTLHCATTNAMYPSDGTLKITAQRYSGS
jgi:hypothetical protein